MKALTQWHATLCLFEGIQGTGANPYVTIEGVAFVPQQNGAQPAVPPPGQQQQAIPQQVPNPQPDGLVEEDPPQDLGYGARTHDFVQNQQYRAGGAEAPTDFPAPFPDFEEQRYPDAPGGAFQGHFDPGFPDDFFGMPAQQPLTAANVARNTLGDDRPRRCERCERKHIKCDYKRPCGNCTKFGRGRDECIPRTYIRRPSASPGQSKPKPKPKPRLTLKVRAPAQTMGGKPGSVVDWVLFRAEERDDGGQTRGGKPGAAVNWDLFNTGNRGNEGQDAVMGGFNPFEQMTPAPEPAPNMVGYGETGEADVEAAEEQNGLQAHDNSFGNFNLDFENAADDSKDGDYHA